MAEIESDVMSGRYAIACRKLERLLSWKADRNGGIVYLLGSCELARGRSEAAAKAWARVEPGSMFSERAIRGRLRLLQESGRFADAERLINGAASDRRNDRTAVLVMLVPALSGLGRLEEARRLVEDRWEHLNAIGEGSLEPAINLVRLHVDLTSKPTDVESLRNLINQAARRAPNDDRVWLGQACLAIRTGADDEATQWLDACQRARPDDVPVWRARLSWGVATDRIDVVEEAVTHIPASEFVPGQLHRLSAWVASRRGDVEVERRELEQQLNVDPGDLSTLERLAQLAEQGGRGEQAARLRRMRGEIDELRARYEKLHERKQPLRDAVELARLAARLGREFEARGFFTVAISDDPKR
jgi:tetratricopeptide (TPR) repeat protein